jgi:DedD protein
MAANPAFRQRVVGMILILLMAAIIAPLVLRGPEEVRLALDLELPPEPAPAVMRDGPLLTSDQVEKVARDIDKAMNEVSQVSPESTGDPYIPVTDETIPQGWSVQLASLTNQANATALAAKLRDAGYRSHVRVVGQGVDRRYRVFAGPELERERAVELRATLQEDSRFGSEGLVVPFTP